MAKPHKTLFFGSPALAVPALDALASAGDLQILAAVTQPDRPAGRGRALTAPAVKTRAEALAIDVWQPKSIRKEHFALRLEELQADFFVIVAYGRILPPRLLRLPRFGCVNLHFSLLPAYRGAAPVNWALINGEEVTGVTTMLMDEGLDTGPVLLRRRVEIEPHETAAELGPRLAALGAELLLDTMRRFAAGRVEPEPQESSGASVAPMLRKEDGLIDWSLEAGRIINLWRGLQPWPGVYSGFRGKLIKLVALNPVHTETTVLPPGSLLPRGDRLLVACGGGALVELPAVQPAGKRAMSAAEFNRGYRPAEAERLEAPPA